MGIKMILTRTSWWDYQKAERDTLLDVGSLEDLLVLIGSFGEEFVIYPPGFRGRDNEYWVLEVYDSYRE